MRIPSYISPSQVTRFYNSRESYYIDYLADNRPERTRQTPAMALGNSYDSHITRALALRYFGRSDPRCSAGGEYCLDTMLDSGIPDASVRRVVQPIGLELFKRYLATGAYARLCLEIDAADPGSLVMQQQIWYSVGDGLTLMGFPDLFFTRGGVPHCYDFKCNGFFSQASPLKGHTWNTATQASHKKAILGKHSCGTTLDMSGVFNSDYRRQCSTYAWALQGGYQGEIVVGIEQVACKAASTRWSEPVIMYGERAVAASYVSARELVSPEVQGAVLAEYVHMWSCITTGHIFDDLPLAESVALCASLELQASGLAVDADLEFNRLSGR